MSQYTGKPCARCGRKKSPTYADKRLCATCTREQKAKRSATAHGTRLRANFGTDPEEYWEQYERQGGKCAIHGCRATGKVRRLSVDHNHKCEEGHDPEHGCPKCRRGLLCGFHNTLIGRAHDDPEVFRSLANYLENPPWQS